MCVSQSCLWLVVHVAPDSTVYYVMAHLGVNYNITLTFDPRRTGDFLSNLFNMWVAFW